MKDKKIVEIVELGVQKRWEYLTQYYNLAAEFFGATDQVVSEEEIDNCVKSFKEKPMPVFRKQIHLKQWKFKLDDKREGVRNEYFSGLQDESRWEDVSIPHAIMHVPNDPVRYGRIEYCALVTAKGEYCDIWRGDYDTWYKNRLSSLQISDDEVVCLDFASANLTSTVWVNERPVMLDHLGLFPFKMDVTEEMKAGNGKAIIAVKVSNIASTVPEMFYNGIQYAYSQRPYTNGRTELDWMDQVWTGLSGDVTLSVMNKTHIENIFVYTDNIQGSSANQVFEIKLRNAQWKRFNGRIRLDISRWLPCEGKIEKSLEQDVTILPMNDAGVKISLNFDDALLWDVDTPNMYLVHAVLLNNDGKELDDVFESFGIRTIKMSGNSFLLNNKKMVPRGTHDVCNYYGEPIICPGDRIIVKDILLHKKMGSNCSRWPSDIRMHYKKIAEYCDQLGFMLSWTGYFEMWTINPEAEMYAARDVKAMIHSLRNCPSIIIWEMGDEVLMNIQDYRRIKWFDFMYNLVVAEDRTRPVITSGMYANELVELIHNHDDTKLSIEEKRQKLLEEYPLFNRELAVWDIHNCPLLPPIKPTRPFMDRVTKALGGHKPTIYTEFGTDGLPSQDKIQNIYGKFRWSENMFIISSREKMDTGIYGKSITADDWRQTQACQAYVIGGMIGYFREHPNEYAGYYFVTMFDLWTFYWGAVDVAGNCKLMYFAARNYFNTVYVSGIHGGTAVEKGECINITASNYLDVIDGLEMQVIIKDMENKAILEKNFKGIHLDGSAALTELGAMETEGIGEGLYSIEYYLKTDGGGENICKNIELFYLV